MSAPYADQGSTSLGGGRADLYDQSVRTMGTVSVAGLCALVLAACGGPAAAPACTEIGSEPGISVTIEKDLGTSLSDLKLTVCIATKCSDYPVQLAPGSTTVGDTCPSTASPDTACSASASPDGTQVGFVRIEKLATGTISVSATGKLGANALTLASTEITVAATFPNGAQCPAGANQAHVTLSSSGIR